MDQSSAPPQMPTHLLVTHVPIADLKGIAALGELSTSQVLLCLQALSESGYAIARVIAGAETQMLSAVPDSAVSQGQ